MLVYDALHYSSQSGNDILSFTLIQTQFVSYESFPLRNMEREDKLQSDLDYQFGCCCCIKSELNEAGR